MGHGPLRPYPIILDTIQNTMKRIYSILILLCCVLSMSAKSGEPGFFARIIPDRQQVIAGDSMLVSVVLYAQYPIAEAECTNTLKITSKGKATCKSRRLPINRDATASRTRENGRIYYTLVMDQYVVAPSEATSFSIQPLKFKAKLQEVVSMPDFFDQMMGARPEYRTHQVSTTSDTFTFEASPKPTRSTQEMIRSGATLL